MHVLSYFERLFKDYILTTTILSIYITLIKNIFCGTLKVFCNCSLFYCYICLMFGQNTVLNQFVSNNFYFWNRNIILKKNIYIYIEL